MNSQTPVYSRREAFRAPPPPAQKGFISRNIEIIAIIAGAILLAIGLLASSHGLKVGACTVGGLFIGGGLIKLMGKTCCSHSKRLVPKAIELSNNRCSIADNIRHMHTKQMAKFDGATSHAIRADHYDWWMFPVSRQATQDPKGLYIARPKVVETLKNDPSFMAKYREGVKIVCRAYGYDVEGDNPQTIGKTSMYFVRFGKMLDSLKLFGEEQLHRNVAEIVRPYHPKEQWIQRAMVWDRQA